MELIHMCMKGYLFNIFKLDRSISIETTCLAMVQILPVNSKRISNALQINGSTRKHWTLKQFFLRNEAFETVYMFVLRHCW